MKFLYKYAALKNLYQTMSKLQKPTLLLFTVLLLAGLYSGLYLAPSDYQQGDSFRIMYLHVPMALLSMGVYSFIAFNYAVFLIWRVKFANILAKASIATGAWFTFLALITGAIWGKPTWGAFWIWDARLTSELILLFIYFALIGLNSAFEVKATKDKVMAIFALIAWVNIPIIHYSVLWFNTLHQGPSISKFAKPDIAWPMLYPLLLMLGAFSCYFALCLFKKSKILILEQEQDNAWVQALSFRN